MTLAEKILYHQLHPTKLAADIGAEIVSLPLLWYHYLAWGLVTHFAPAFIASALLIRFGDFESTKQSPRGRYLLRYMTPAAQLVRLLADIAMMIAAWYREPVVIALGLVVVVVAWTYSLLWRRPRRA
jgi:hypothetical protein